MLIAALAASGCAHKNRARLPAPPVAPGPGYVENGTASWYGRPYDGRRAANGEIYDMEKLTAAHRTLPFDTWLHVVNLDNSKTVDVRITDRGPFVDGRIIDLSHAAAVKIGMIGPGTAKVRLELLKAPANLPPAAFAVQVGSFRIRDNAEKMRAEMADRYGSARLVPRAGSPEMFRVLVGSEPTQERAAALAARIHEESFERIAALVVRIDTE